MGKTLVLLCWFPVLLWSQQRTIQCFVKDSTSGENLSGTTVLLEYRGKTEVLLTDDSGLVSIVSNPKDSLTITFKYLGYGDQKFSSKDLRDQQVVFMKKSSFLIREVEVSAKKQIRENATLFTFQVNDYADSTEFNVEELLAKIGQFTINSEGEIYFMGLAIDEILIDGSSMSPDDYKLISRMLNPTIIDSIVVDLKYGDNLISKSLDIDQKIVVDLKLTKKKIIINSSVKLALGIPSLYEANGNSLLKRGKNKVLFNLTSNTIGEFNHFNNGGEKLNANYGPLYSHYEKERFISDESAMANKSRYVRNWSSAAHCNASFEIKKWTIGFNTHFGKELNALQSNTEFKYFLTPSLINDTKTNTDRQLITFEANIKNIISTSQELYFYSFLGSEDYQHLINLNTTSSNQNEALTQNLGNTLFRLQTGAKYLHRFNEKLYTSAMAYYSDNGNHSNLYTQNISTQSVNGTNDRELSHHTYGFRAEVFLNFSKYLSHISIENYRKNFQSNNHIQLADSAVQNKIIAGENRFDGFYQDLRLDLNNRITFRGFDLNIDLGLSKPVLHFNHQRLQQNLYVLPDIEMVSKEIVLFFYRASFKRRLELLPHYPSLQAPFYSDINSITTGIETPVLALSNHWNGTMGYRNRDNTFDVSASFSRNARLQSVIYKNTRVADFILREASLNTTPVVLHDVYLKSSVYAAKLSLRFSNAIQYNAFRGIFLTDKEVAFTAHNYNNIFSVKSGFLGMINFEFNYTFPFYRNIIADQVPNFQVVNRVYDVNVYGRIHKKYVIALNNSMVSYNNSPKPYFFTDLELKMVKVFRKLDVVLNVNNLFNVRQFEWVSNFVGGERFNRVGVRPRMIYVTTRFNF